MPTKDNEVILYGSKDSFYLTNPEQRILNAKCNIRDYSSNSLTESVKIVGIAFNEDNLYVEPTIYVGEKVQFTSTGSLQISLRWLLAVEVSSCSKLGC